MTKLIDALPRDTSWRSKQNVVVGSSAEAKYRAIATATSELIKIKQLH